MPVDLNSRYYGLSVYEAPDSEGQVQATVAMRREAAQQTLAAYQHVLSGAETLEYLAWRQYGSSTAWWRIADANPLVFPLDLQPGVSVSLPAERNRGRVERTRRF